MSAPDPALLDEFCDTLWLEDGLARNTLDGYRRDLVQLGRWLESARRKTLLQAEHSDLLAYLAYRVRARAKATTTSRLLSSVKRFYQHARIPVITSVATGSLITKQFVPPRYPDNFVFRISANDTLQAATSQHPAEDCHSSTRAPGA